MIYIEIKVKDITGKTFIRVIEESDREEQDIQIMDLEEAGYEVVSIREIEG